MGIDAADISEEGGSEDGSEGEQEEQDEEEQDRGRPQFTSPSRLRTVAVSPSRDVSQVGIWHNSRYCWSKSSTTPELYSSRITTILHSWLLGGSQIPALPGSDCSAACLHV